MKNILFAASEAVPFIKTGGLADVTGSLPGYLDPEKYDCRVILPKYLCMKPELAGELRYLANFYISSGGRERYAGIFEAEHGGIRYYFIDNEECFGGDRPYGDWLYDLEKFIFFSKAVLTALPVIGFRPDVIHCHDWQTAMIPVYLKEVFHDSFYEGIRTVMTIHNLQFQGSWDAGTVQRLTGLPDRCFTPDTMEYYGSGNLLKGGIVYADRITTVSRSYAEEIRTEYYGEGLDGLLRARAESLRGIVNGIDYREFDPASDPYIAKCYSEDDFRRRKKLNKVRLQEQLGLEKDPGRFMVGMVSRLTPQKGLDLVRCVLEEICAEDVQLVVLGTGDEQYERMFRDCAAAHPDRAAASFYYSEELAHRIYAASDAFLMPSKFEPCGLSQLIALRYGSVPVVRETGGLRDTVEPYNEYEDRGTGFSFRNFNAHEMLFTLQYAKRVYYGNKRAWNRITERAMRMDYSWNASARLYEELYEEL